MKTNNDQHNEAGALHPFVVIMGIGTVAFILLIIFMAIRLWMTPKIEAEKKPEQEIQRFTFEDGTVLTIVGNGYKISHTPGSYWLQVESVSDIRNRAEITTTENKVIVVKQAGTYWDKELDKEVHTHFQNLSRIGPKEPYIIALWKGEPLWFAMPDKPKKEVK